MTNCNGPVEAVDCDMHSVRYDMAVKRGMVLEYVLAAIPNGSHQVTYDAVATLIRNTSA